MYERFYGLTAKPFRLTPDARFLFQSRGHGKALAYLRYGLQSGEGFVVITGDVGTGKTTLAQALLGNLNADNILAAQLVSTNLGPEDTLRMVAATFGLASQDLSKTELLRNFKTFLTTRVKEGKRVLLVVDEVQNLPVESIEELRMLSNYQSGEKALLQVFFLGQSEFIDTMQSGEMEQFRQRVIAAHHLDALDAEETKKYINHRLQLAGWKNDPDISSDAYLAVHELSGGIPRRINALCDKALLSGCLEESHLINEATIRAIAVEANGLQDSRKEAAELNESARDDDEGDESQSYPTRMIPDSERRIRALEKRMSAVERHRDRLIELLRLLLDDDDAPSGSSRKADGSR